MLLSEKVRPLYSARP